ncbi:hypothetical protein [Candidatus Pseudothioglobus singularis]|uniref:hypothetical protein n=1 Tax=Candidatus Pseudothioglobus singularis TaxID=1427364 RepID=UPI0011876227|nr:hypothetical protein [Candidatus Pseudothioglobus singularis]
MLKNSILNARTILFIIRGATLVSKFLLIVYMARKLSVVDLGLYGFITAAIFATVYIAGLEHGSITARQIINCKDFLCKQKTVFGLTIFTLIMFFLISPISYLFITSKVTLSLDMVILFFIIVYGESYSTEHKKILISLNQPVYSSVVDFIKSGVWAYLTVIFVSLNIFNLSIRNILFMWALSVIIGCFLVFIKLIKYYGMSVFATLPSIKTYGRQIYLTLPFFVTGISLIVFELSGRFSLQIINAQVEAGIYTLYSGFIFAIPLFVWSSSVAFDHSKILQAYENEEVSKSDSLIKVMLKRSLLICLFLVAFLYFFFDLLLILIEKIEYINYINDFYLFLLVPFFHIIDSHLYYMLYTRKRDKANALSSLAGVVFLFIFQYLTIDLYGITSVIFSIILALIISIVLKIFFIKKNMIAETIPQ